MSVAPATDDGDRPDSAEGDRGPVNGRADGSLVPSQAAWFGLTEDDEPPASGLYAGLVFNRPIEQVLTYRVPVRLAGLIRVGQRVRAPWAGGTSWRPATACGSTARCPIGSTRCGSRS